MEGFMGEIRMVAGLLFTPRNYADCDGKPIPIKQNRELFSLFGTNYGGDGRTTFGLPDFRGRATIHHGQGPGLTNRVIGFQQKLLRVNDIDKCPMLISGVRRCLKGR